MTTPTPPSEESSVQPCGHPIACINKSGQCQWCIDKECCEGNMWVLGKARQLEQQLATAFEQVRVLREALEFYADERNYDTWERIEGTPTIEDSRSRPLVWFDDGDRAREALEKALGAGGVGEEAQDGMDT